MKQKSLWATSAIGVAITLAIPLAASAASVVTLKLVDTFQRSSPFGLAFDGTNLHWQSSDNVIHEMTTAGVDTGNTTINPEGWSALGWDGSQLVSARNTNVTFFDRFTGANQSSVTTDPGVTGIISLIDGLDYDHGEIWHSPDVGNVYRLASDGSFAGANPALGGAGGYSGVERVDIPMGGSYLIVVNDASSPRRLCIHLLSDYSELGCSDFSNERYEDLAFDGRFLYAADFFGGKIDKIDLLVDGDPIFDPNSTPEPSSLLGLLGISALGGMSLLKRKGQKKS